jgi:hypothetical protein
MTPDDLGLEGGVAAAVEDLARFDFDDLSHGNHAPVLLGLAAVLALV